MSDNSYGSNGAIGQGQDLAKHDLKTVAVIPEIHAQLKKLQKTPYGEQTMSWVIAQLLKKNEPDVKREKQQ